MDNIDYMDRVLQVTQLSVYSPQRHYRKCLRQNTTNVFGEKPQNTKTESLKILKRKASKY